MEYYISLHGGHYGLRLVLHITISWLELPRTAEDQMQERKESIVLSTLPLINVHTCYALDEAEIVMTLAAGGLNRRAWEALYQKGFRLGCYMIA